MAGTSPFVVAYQILATPITSGVLLIGWTVWQLEPASSSVTSNPAIIVLSISTALIAFITISTLSVAGLYDGWITGWRYGQGMKLRDALSSAPAYNKVKEGMRLLIGSPRDGR